MIRPVRFAFRKREMETAPEFYAVDISVQTGNRPARPCGTLHLRPDEFAQLQNLMPPPELFIGARPVETGKPIPTLYQRGRGTVTPFGPLAAFPAPLAQWFRRCLPSDDRT